MSDLLDQLENDWDSFMESLPKKPLRAMSRVELAALSQDDLAARMKAAADSVLRPDQPIGRIDDRS